MNLDYTPERNNDEEVPQAIPVLTEVDQARKAVVEQIVKQTGIEGDVLVVSHGPGSMFIFVKKNSEAVPSDPFLFRPTTFDFPRKHVVMRHEDDLALEVKGEGTTVQPIKNTYTPVRGNAPCPCGCGKKFKNCPKRNS